MGALTTTDKRNYFDGKRVLVTGGTGSFGKVFVHRVLSGELGTPKKIIVFSRDEAKQHDMRVSYLHKQHVTDDVIFRNFQNTLEFRIGDVRSYRDVCGALRDVDVVINAAALKQVPTCEYFPVQAIETNCLGPANIIQAIQEHRFPIETVLGVSTDKACKPVNVMGMTKAIQERVFISANVLNPETRFICVRYGNVLASRGSVIPLFHDQIANGGPITITTRDMTRFLLSLDQAVDTVFEALMTAKSGETYIPRVPSATVVNIARALIGERNIDIRFIGIRPGEKIHEILISDEEATRAVDRGKYYAICPMLPEVSQEEEKKFATLTKEYSSGDNLVDYEGTKELLKNHRLMIEDRPSFLGAEMLR